MTHKERMLSVLYDKKIPDKVPHGDVTVDPKIAQAVFKTQIPEEKGNFLVYWMTEPFSDRFFERHRRLREFLGFDFAHVFPREPLTKIGDTKEGYPIIRDVWGGQVIAAPHSTEELASPIPDITKAADYKFPDVSNLIEKHHELPPDAIIEQIKKAISLFSGRDIFDDDLSCIAIRIGSAETKQK